MSSSALMSIGMRAMFANYASMQTTGHNIANAQTPGYSRQTVQLADVRRPVHRRGLLRQGRRRRHRAARERRVPRPRRRRSPSSMAATDDARSTNLQQLETVFPPGDNGMGAAVGSFMNSFVDLANSPADSSARQVILSDAAEVADRFATAGGAARSRCRTASRPTCATRSRRSTRWPRRSPRSTATSPRCAARSSAPNDLLDQRDQLVKQIGNLVKVSTITADDGTMGVFIAGGQRLVLGAEAQQLAVTPDPANTGALGDLDQRQRHHARAVHRPAGGRLDQRPDEVPERGPRRRRATSWARWPRRCRRASTRCRRYGIDMSSPAGAGQPDLRRRRPDRDPQRAQRARRLGRLRGTRLADRHRRLAAEGERLHAGGRSGQRAATTSSRARPTA